jgi:hypothetical protein
VIDGCVVKVSLLCFILSHVSFQSILKQKKNAQCASVIKMMDHDMIKKNISRNAVLTNVAQLMMKGVDS